MDFVLVSPISHIEIIAIGRQIEILDQLQQEFGRGRWRKLKGMAWVQYADGRVEWEEVHWYEAHGSGRKRMKVKDWNQE
jgi:hypothetical protein